MRVCFTSNERGERSAWTEGMREQNPAQAELGATLQWEPDERRDAQAKALLTFLRGYVARHNKPIRADQCLRYGWTLLRAVPDQTEADRLRLHELADPFDGEETSFVDGVASALRLLATQQEAIARCRIVGTAEHPYRGDTAIVCRNVARAGGTPLTLVRQAITHREFHDSGWLVGCQDHAHDHDDPGELSGVLLWRVVAAYPWIFPYLGMPAGIRVTLERDWPVIFRAHERRGHVDDAPLFAPPRPRG